MMFIGGGRGWNTQLTGTFDIEEEQAPEAPQQLLFACFAVISGNAGGNI